MQKTKKQIPVALAWSGGKDSAYMLHMLRQHSEYMPVRLFTTLTEDGRIGMHDVRLELLREQVAALRLPLTEISLPVFPSNELYTSAILQLFAQLQRQEVHHVAFGDLFLEDIRSWREALCQRAGITPVFPLWGLNTQELAHRMVADGFKATLCCVDTRAMPAQFAGRAYDMQLLADLPAAVDPCGENGEFHTFVHDGPGFYAPVPCQAREVVLRGTFAYIDLFPASS